MPSRNFTVRSALVETTPVASSADAPDEVTRELSATQSALNSRRFSNPIFTHYTIRSTEPIVVVRDGGSAVFPLTKISGAGKRLRANACQVQNPKTLKSVRGFVCGGIIPMSAFGGKADMTWT